MGTPTTGHRDDTGSATIELAVLMPVVLALIFLIVQGGVLFHTRNVAALAARDGLRAATTWGGTPAAGETRARSALAATAGDWLTVTTVTATRTDTTATVTVTGRALSLLPGIPGPTIGTTATGPVETTTG
jgi:Flp pilus assembly protein TadG